MTDKILIDSYVVEQALEALDEIAWSNDTRWQSDRADDVRIVLRAALEQQQVEQEPVAEITGMDEYGPMLGWHKHWVEFPIGTQLYTRPQPRQPLTDEEIKDILKPLTLTVPYRWRDIVNAIERAHGIVGE